MITKVLHLYWGKNQPLSFLRYMTIWSFARYNPDWEIRLWVPSVPSNLSPWTTGEQSSKYDGIDYLPKLGKYTHIFDFESVGINSELSEVHRSDLIRWFLLGLYGGVWSDMDILYTAPMSRVMGYMQGIGLCRYKAILNNDTKFLAIGFMFSEGVDGYDFFSGLFHQGVDLYRNHPYTNRYQGYGAELLRDYLAQRGYEEINWFSPKWIYPWFMGKDTGKYWEPGEVPGSILGYHWYAGSPQSGQCEKEVDYPDLEALGKKYSICKEAHKLWTA